VWTIGPPPPACVEQTHTRSAAVAAPPTTTPSQPAATSPVPNSGAAVAAPPTTAPSRPAAAWSVPGCGAEASGPPKAPDGLHGSGVVRAEQQRRDACAAEGCGQAAQFCVRPPNSYAAAPVPRGPWRHGPKQRPTSRCDVGAAAVARLRPFCPNVPSNSWLQQTRSLRLRLRALAAEPPVRLLEGVPSCCPAGQEWHRHVLVPPPGVGRSNRAAFAPKRCSTPLPMAPKAHDLRRTPARCTVGS
jgi:hypothetical protein